jgi:hypothetical protein
LRPAWLRHEPDGASFFALDENDSVASFCKASFLGLAIDFLMIHRRWGVTFRMSIYPAATAMFTKLQRPEEVAMAMGSILA